MQTLSRLVWVAFSTPILSTKNNENLFNYKGGKRIQMRSLSINRKTGKKIVYSKFAYSGANWKRKKKLRILFKKCSIINLFPVVYVSCFWYSEKRETCSIM